MYRYVIINAMAAMKACWHGSKAKIAGNTANLMSVYAFKSCI